MRRPDLPGAVLWSSAALAAALAFFHFVPGVDLWVAGAAYRPGEGFALAGQPVLGAVRIALWNSEIVLFLFATCALAYTLVRRRPFLGLGARYWSFVTLMFVIGSGLIIEAGLKGHSGRARPANVVEFGGDRLFTPAASLSDQCAANCSFVAGEVASATAMGAALIAALWLLRARLPRRAPVWGWGLGVGMPVLVALERVGSGRHFLSDAVIAGLIMVALGPALAHVLGLTRAPPD